MKGEISKRNPKQGKIISLYISDKIYISDPSFIKKFNSVPKVNAAKRFKAHKPKLQAKLRKIDTAIKHDEYISYGNSDPNFNGI